MRTTVGERFEMEVAEARSHIAAGCCRACNRGVSACGVLNERGFCEMCVYIHPYRADLNVTRRQLGKMDHEEMEVFRAWLGLHLGQETEERARDVVQMIRDEITRRNDYGW